MGTRVSVTISNTTSEPVECSNLSCAALSGLSVGAVITKGDYKIYTSDSNNRIFVQFTGQVTGTVFSLAMTCPELSDNSATGYGNGGCQQYSGSGTPANFTFNLGQSDQADWGGGKSVPYGVSYGACS